MASIAVKLKKLEARIETNIKKAWYENGLCLMEIQQDKLYKKDHDTFEDYIKEKWGFSRIHGHHLISGAKTFQLLEHEIKANFSNEKGKIVNKIEPILPSSEWQIRPLLSLGTDAERVHVWDTIVGFGEKITAKVVKREVEAFQENPTPVAGISFEAKNTNITSSKKEVLYAPGKNDECYTPVYAVKAITPHLDKSKIIWCPFDKEDSHFVTELQAAGFTVTYSHIDYEQDFYEYEPDNWDVIVSNPPFSRKRQIFERALSFGKPFALIMSNTWMNDAAPKQIFKERGLQLLMFHERMKFLNQDNSENKITFSSSYFCCDMWEGRDIKFASLKEYGYGK